MVCYLSIILGLVIAILLVLILNIVFDDLCSDSFQLRGITRRNNRLGGISMGARYASCQWNPCDKCDCSNRVCPCGSC
jgi:hypothetical protein